MDPYQAEAWLRGVIEELLETSAADRDPLGVLRSAAGALVAGGALAEARAESVAAEGGYAFAMRGLAESVQLAAQPPRRAAPEPARRGGSGEAIALPFSGWGTTDQGHVPVQAYLRTGGWGRLVGYAEGSISHGAARVECVDRRGTRFAAISPEPVPVDGWSVWTYPIASVSREPVESVGRASSIPGDPAPGVSVESGPSPTEHRSTQHLRLACTASLAALVAGEEPRDRLAAILSALLAQGGPIDTETVSAARALSSRAVGATLPASWTSVLDPARPHRVARRLSCVAPIRSDVGSTRVVVNAVVPGHCSFLLAAQVWPWNPTIVPTRLNAGDNTRLGWWAHDDQGHWYVGRAMATAEARIDGLSRSADLGADMAVTFRPPIDPDASALTIVVS